MSYSYGKSIVTDGLVFYVDAGNGNSYPGSGTTWSDLAGGNDGTLAAGPTYASANGGSIVFDGTDDYVDYNSFGVGGDSSSYTFSAWSKNSNNSNILVKGRDGNGAGWSLRIATSSNQFIASAVKLSPVAAYNVFGGAYESSVWAYVTGVWGSDTGKLSLYVNGSLEGSYTFSGTAPFALRSSTIGWSMAKITNSSIGQGSIACASVYNRALSASEILQNYNALKSRFV
jgi:hypothetical protein